MRIGIPKEIKTAEKRVALMPEGVASLIQSGHEVFIESDAGLGSGFIDGLYIAAGAHITDQEEVWDQEMVVKVKEPIGRELDLMKSGQILFTYLHLAASKELTLKLMERGVEAYAYEAVQLDNGSLPLLKPMSEVAGKLSVQMGARCLEAVNGGKGKLLGGVSGVSPAKVVILGAGVAGTNACEVALGMGAKVVVLDVNQKKLDNLWSIRDIAEDHWYRLEPRINEKDVLPREIRDADLIISTILVPNAKAPKLLTRKMFIEMEPGSAFVDVSIDQGGSAETSRPTTHTDPIFKECGVVHYCVANMPGAVPMTSTRALCTATFPYVKELAERQESVELVRGLSVSDGMVVCEEVKKCHGV